RPGYADQHGMLRNRKGGRPMSEIEYPEEFVYPARRELERLEKEIARLEKDRDENVARRSLLTAVLDLYKLRPYQETMYRWGRKQPKVITQPKARTGPRAATRVRATLPEVVGVCATLPKRRQVAHPTPRQKVTREEVIETLGSLSANHPEGIGPQ